MKNLLHYKLLKSEWPEELGRLVVQETHSGYELYGSPFTIVEDDSDGVSCLFYVQAVIAVE